MHSVFSVVVLLTVIASVFAGYETNDLEEHQEEHYSHVPVYAYDYSVKDPHTGDNKQQWESRHGDVVKGGYALHEPDGRTRLVLYTSDKHNGFRAVVKFLGEAQHQATITEHHGF